MLGKKKILPPLDYLLAFESAAKQGSFAKASRELNISETSISRKVRLLELHYDVPLFVRGHRSISLTSQGLALLGPVAKSLDELRDASQEMFSRRQSNAVTLAATNSVASLWLMPRLRKFNRTNSRVKINLVASDVDTECLADGVDLTILRGDGLWPGYSSRLLFGETIFPVCSPQYLQANPSACNTDDLPNLDLIEVRSTHTEWMNWSAWFGHAEINNNAIEGSALFNTYPLAVQAAVDGLGMALGWGHLVGHLLDAGQLVRPVSNVEVRTKSGYYLLQPEQAGPSTERKIVEEWLLKASASRKRYAQRMPISV